MTPEKELDNLEKKLTVLQCALQEVRRATADVAAAWRDLPPALAKRLTITDNPVSVPSVWAKGASISVEASTNTYPENGETWIVLHGQDGSKTIVPME